MMIAEPVEQELDRGFGRDNVPENSGDSSPTRSSQSCRPLDADTLFLSLKPLEPDDRKLFREFGFWSAFYTVGGFTRAGPTPR